MTLVTPYANWSVESSHSILSLLSIRSRGPVVSIGAYRSHLWRSTEVGTTLAAVPRPADH